MSCLSTAVLPWLYRVIPRRKVRTLRNAKANKTSGLLTMVPYYRTAHTDNSAEISQHSVRTICRSWSGNLALREKMVFAHTPRLLCYFVALRMMNMSNARTDVSPKGSGANNLYTHNDCSREHSDRVPNTYRAGTSAETTLPYPQTRRNCPYGE